jgi:hypothetical protein
MKKIIFCLLFLSTFLFAQQYREHLVAWWHFDDSTANDHSGNGYHGLIRHSPEPVEGIYNTAFEFEGTGYYGDKAII